MRKTKIEIRNDIIACTNARKAAQLTVDIWCDKITNVADSDKKAKIEFTNVK